MVEVSPTALPGQGYDLNRQPGVLDSDISGWDTWRFKVEGLAQGSINVAAIRITSHASRITSNNYTRIKGD